MTAKADKALSGRELKASVLRFMAREEPLVATLGAFPQLDRARLQKILETAATLVASGGNGSAIVAEPAGPTYHRIRVYSDGVSRGRSNLAGAGAILVEPSGQVVDRLGKFLGKQTTNFAEYSGLLLGLRRAAELNVAEVEVFADSELMIRQLGGRFQVRSTSLRPLYEESLRLLNGFQRVKLVHVPREMNRAADEMSNRAIDERL
jgi:ribonuclease HI